MSKEILYPQIQGVTAGMALSRPAAALPRVGMGRKKEASPLDFDPSAKNRSVHEASLGALIDGSTGEIKTREAMGLDCSGPLDWIGRTTMLSGSGDARSNLVHRS
jgi:hypothetical protein